MPAGRPDVYNAFDEAAKNIRKAMGTDYDPDVRFYEQLTPADFEEMKQEWGFDTLQRYIQEMEYRRHAR